uniref:C2 domain-containing protein n=1 Tax=Salix viminalis TaxID=40686 RepID=A0A6N2MEN0_SALVM
MASQYEVEITISSAKDLKNVNWRHGSLNPYAVVWVDSNYKCSTRADDEGDTSPFWDQTLVIPLPSGRIEDHSLHIDIVHAGSHEGTKPLIGSAKLKLIDVLDDAGLSSSIVLPADHRGNSTLRLLSEILAILRLITCTSLWVPPPSSSRDYPYATPYGAPPPQPNQYYSTAAPPPPTYWQPSYGYGERQPVVVEEKKKSKFGGMGTGLAVGAVGGVLGGLALAEGIDAFEDDIADDAAEKVEDDLAYGDDAGGW